MSEIDRRGFMAVAATGLSLPALAKRLCSPEPEPSVSEDHEVRESKTDILVPGKWFRERRKDLLDSTLRMLEHELPRKDGLAPESPQMKDEWWDMLFDDVFKYHSYVQIVARVYDLIVLDSVCPSEKVDSGKVCISFHALELDSKGDFSFFYRVDMLPGSYWHSDMHSLWRVADFCEEHPPLHRGFSLAARPGCKIGPLSEQRALVGINSAPLSWTDEYCFCSWALFDQSLYKGKKK